MRTLLRIVIVALLVLVSTGLATAEPPDPGTHPRTTVWYDDIEGDVSGWHSVDLSESYTSHFHWDQYMAFGGSGYSWWCGTLDYDYDGGYGNMWDDRLNIPEVDLSSAIYAVLTFAYRHDSEYGYDYTWVQAESLGVFKNLNRGFDGVAPWTDIGMYGYVLNPYDNPLVARFRFLSDCAGSDEDGGYLTQGGAFAVDKIKIYDYYTGLVHFYDSEPGSAGEDECIPGAPEPAGDYWHVIDRACPALSDPHSWWCGDDADTGFVPPNLRDALYSPVLDLTAYGTVVACTAHFAIHEAIPGYAGQDYCKSFVTCDGVNYYQVGYRPGYCSSPWRFDFGQCDGWHSQPYYGYSLEEFCPGGVVTHAGLLWVMYTDDNGCGPGGAGDAGAMIDDVWFSIAAASPVEESSWGTIKAMYR
jgi:hypothetical protein